MSNSTDIIPLLQQCKTASRRIKQLPDAERSALVAALGLAITNDMPLILAANRTDLEAMPADHPMRDRLLLTPQRLEAIANATEMVAALPNPVGRVLRTYHHPNGLLIQAETVPLGVVGAIYEARPNVTADIAALCLRSGNAVVLKGGSDADHSNRAIVQVLGNVLEQYGLPRAIITLLPPDRSYMKTLLQAEGYVDVLIPRGSQALIDFVRREATVPVIETGAGVCHTYVHASASLQMALQIVTNAKTQRPSVCNALDTILVDEAIAPAFLSGLPAGFASFGVKVFADPGAYSLLNEAGYQPLRQAQPADFGREFLSQQCSIKLVNNLDEALQHIDAHSSKHSEAIVCSDAAIAERFLREVDAAAVYHNASTRFTDGGEFGLGAELGISTQKLHARGPFALEKLVCEKWIIRGEGQIR